MEKEILKIVTNWNIKKFNSVYNSIKDQTKKDQIKKWFDLHMKQISDFCIKNFDKDNLTVNFIKNLHKIHYPKWYRRFKKSLDWKTEVCTMIPWEYKTIENFPEVKPKDVKKEMEKIVDYYNKNYKNSKNILDLISYFILNFIKIHPFWDWNWTVWFILFDLLLFYNWYKPIYIKKIFSKEEIYINIKKSIKNNDISFFKKAINL